MVKTFAEILEIYNGRSQKDVENPSGAYPIYGSGGIMGYADRYICPPDTIVLGRKGSINNPIFVDRAFWNVDTAFGLVANQEMLRPKYLYYFCRFFDFEKLNTTVTIPSLTKANLLKISLDLPPLSEQDAVINRMEQAKKLIALYQQQLAKLDELVKARFVEMFGGVTETVPLSHYIFGLVAGKSLASEAECPNKVLKTGAVTHDYFDATQVKNLPANYHPIPDHQVNKGDILISRMNTVELVGAAAYVWDAPKNTYLPDRLWRAELQSDTNPVFVWQLLVQPTTKREIRSIASGTSGSMKNISKQGLLSVSAKRIPFDLQNQFAAFVTQVEKSKAAVQSALDKAQLLFDSLMQKYFG